MSKIKNGGLDQYGTGSFEQQQFGTVGVEGVNDLQSVNKADPILTTPESVWGRAAKGNKWALNKEMTTTYTKV